jgi:hypothetical protein
VEVPKVCESVITIAGIEVEVEVEVEVEIEVEVVCSAIG